MFALGQLGLGFGTAGASPPPAPSIAVVDNEDGTTTVTVSGSHASSSNSIQTQPVDGDLGSGTWTEQDTRVGDGGVTFALPNGLYHVICVSTLAGCPALSAIAYHRQTDGTDSVHQQCLDAIRARIQLLSLSGIANSSVVVRKFAIDQNLPSLPCCLIAQHGKAISPRDGTNAKDDYQDLAIVGFIAADNQSLTAGDSGATYLKWEQDFARAFNNQRLPGVSGVYSVRVQPTNPPNPDVWKQSNLYVSAFLLRCLSREPRGLGA